MGRVGAPGRVSPLLRQHLLKIEARRVGAADMGNQQTGRSSCSALVTLVMQSFQDEETM